MENRQIKNPRDIPAIEKLVTDPDIEKAGGLLARPLVVNIVREVVERAKEMLSKTKQPLAYNRLKDRIILEIEKYKKKRIRRIINGTGVLIHTNLGRAPLSEALFDRIKGQITGYGNLEFDLVRGRRGKRGELAEEYLALLSGAESGIIVNNNAAALFLILNSLASRRRVVISRGELVQIGGGFRIPDIIRRSGARLLETGTTNITDLNDYRKALDEKPALILKVHRSNFALKGFAGEVSVKAVAELGRKAGLPVVNDLGSGVFIDTTPFAGMAEPTVQGSVRDGADLTCFSGDKLLGGVQAGLIVGRKELVDRLKKNPVYRAVRVDKIVFSALEELLGYYLNGTWQENIKLWQQASVGEAELYEMGRQLLKKIDAGDRVSLEASEGRIGGGALPEIPLPSVALVFQGDISPEKAAGLFRMSDPPVIGRITDDRFTIDLKAIDRGDMEILVKIIKSVINRL